MKRLSPPPLWRSLLFSLFPQSPNWSEELARQFHLHWQALSFKNRLVLQGIALFFHLSSLLSPWLCPFGWLPPSQQQTYLAFCRRSLWRRKVLQLLNLFLGTVYFSTPSAKRAIGYQIEPLKSAPPPSTPPLTLESHKTTEELLQQKGWEGDVLIVGSGAGGSTLGQFLAQAGLQVLLLEEGKEFHRDRFQGDDLALRFFQLYRDNSFTMTLGNTAILLPVGRTVGGTTVVNSGTCFAPPPFVLERWQKQLGLSLSPQSFYDTVRQIEEDLHIRPVPREVLGRNGEALLRGAEELGWKGGPIARPLGDCRGTGVCIAGCPWDGKLDMRLTYLPRLRRAGGLIASSLCGRKILFQGNRAVGVEAFGPQGEKVTLRAKVVVLACGALATPLLLRASGIRHRPIGRNLHIHPAYTTGGLFEERLEAWRGVMQSAYVDEWLEEGILLEATFPHPPLGYGSGLLPSPEWIPQYPHVAEVGILISDETTGSLRATPAGPWISYSLGPVEVERLVRGIGYAARLLFAAGAKAVFTGLLGAEILRHPQEVEKLVHQYPRKAYLFSLAAFHPMGTCALSAHPREGGCDPSGKVWHTQGLYVADASLIPTSLHVNPQVTIMALAQHVAQQILDKEFSP